jgi:3-phenylpropionate/trans-cinnamate dioxygenase ferredoxin component
VTMLRAGLPAMPETVRLCAARDLEPGEARRFDVGAHRIALVRVDDKFFAVGDRCTHEDYSLAEGEIYVEDCEIECPKHGSLFSLVTGEPLTLPATKAVPVYEVVRR